LDLFGAAFVADDVSWWENTAGDGSAWTEHALNTDLDGARRVSIADLDRDGDLDLLCAAANADRIVWWENRLNDTATFDEHDIDTAFTGARDVQVADLDQDGDLDILGASAGNNELAWWENEGLTWEKHSLTTLFGVATEIRAVDIDQDGDLDIAAVATGSNRLSWWENRGGQFALATTDIADTPAVAGALDDVLSILIDHRGRTGDSSVELATIELLFEESEGDFMTDLEANSLIENLYIYADTGSGLFESGSDTLLATVPDLTLTDGVQEVVLPDDDSNLQVAFGSQALLFVSIDYTDTPLDQLDSLRISHVTEASSKGEDASADLPLILEFVANMPTTTIDTTQVPPIPAQPGAISGTTSLCNGDTGVSYSIAPVSGATGYTWSVPTDATIQSGQDTTSITVDFGMDSGEITVSADNFRGSSILQSLMVDVLNLPAQPDSISGPTSTCANASGVAYSIDAVPDATQYTWSVPTGASITGGQDTTSITVEFGSQPGEVSVYASNSCGDGSRTSLSISIVDIPDQPGSISGDTELCANIQGIVYSISPLAGADNYTWAAPADATITSGQGSDTISVNFGSQSGTISVYASNTCGDGSLQSIPVTVTSPPSQPMGIIGSTAVCTGSSGVAYSIAAVPGADQYTWVVPTGSSIVSGQGSTAITVDFGSVSGSIVVFASNSCGDSPPQDLPVSVQELPNQPGTITGSVEVCQESMNVAYFIAPVQGATQYTWSVPPGATVASGQGTTAIRVDFLDQPGIVSVVASNTCGDSSSQILAVSMLERPSQPGTISGSASVCAGSTGLIYSVVPVIGANNYTWSLPPGASLISGQGTNSISVQFGNQSGDIGVYAANECGGSPIQTLAVSINQAPPQPGGISGASMVCPGSTGAVYSIVPVAGAETYTWSLPTNATLVSGQGSTSIAVDFGSISGTISVYASNTCGDGQPQTLSISMLEIPDQPGLISGPTDACPNETGLVYSIDPIEHAQQYTWSVPEGASIQSGQGTPAIVLDVGTQAGSVSVLASNACGDSLPRTISLPVIDEPAQPGSIAGPTELCAQAAGVSFSISPVGSADEYIWTIPPGSNLVSGQGTTSIIIDLGSTPGDVSVFSRNGCGDSLESNLSIDLLDPVSIQTQPTSLDLCLGESATFNVAMTGSGPFNYQWQKDGVPIVGETTPSLVLDNLTIEDEAVYNCLIENTCNQVLSDSATLSLDGVLSAALNPQLMVLGLSEPMFDLELACELPPLVAVDWVVSPSTVYQVTNQTQIAFDPVPLETTQVDVTVEDSSNEIVQSSAMLLVALNPLFRDFNQDSCNNLKDIWLLNTMWRMPYQEDADGDGLITVLDFLYINLDDPLDCP